MTTVFHAWLYGGSIETQSNFRRKKLHRMNKDLNFLGGSFSNRDNVRAPIQFIRERQPKRPRTDPSSFTSITLVLLDWSNEKSWVFPTVKSINHFMPQATVSHRSDSSSATISSCCHR